MKGRYHALESRSLLAGVQSARREEKRILTDLLHYLVEIDRRKAYLEWGYGNLFAFLTDGLGYDKASAYRRYSATRAMKAMPEIEAKLSDGALTFSQTAKSGSAAKPLPPKFPTLRDQIFKRDGGRCSYVSPITGRRCESTHALEIDHVTPRAHGGTDSPDNLRVLCDPHNRSRFRMSRPREPGASG